MSDLYQKILNNFKDQGLMQTLGASLLSVSDGEVQILLPFSQALSQQHGYIHAGAITSVVDSACGYAALTKAPAGADVVSAEFKINFLRPAIGDRFVAVGRVQNAGKTLTICTGEVRAERDNDPSSKVIALMQATMVIVAPAPKDRLTP